MKRRVASYGLAIKWIIQNDDIEWLDDPCGSISVSAALIADLFGRTEEEVVEDLLRERKKAEK